MSQSLQDNFGRRFSYLRLSITDSCNFRCQYCLPNGYKKNSNETFLSVHEIKRLVTALVELGMWKIRLTGGEPTLRSDFEEISSTISKINGVKKMAFTTNGYRLARYAKNFYNAGYRSVNVSVDSLDPTIFFKTTGRNILDKVLAGIFAAQNVGFESIKINAVLLKGFNDNSFNSFFEFVRVHNFSVRFIELMQTGENLNYFKENHVSAEKIRAQLIENYWILQDRKEADGPAEIYGHKDYKGTIGLITPYKKGFCTSCNRLRVSARGHLRLCLFGSGGINLRPLLQDEEQKEELKELVLNSLTLKKETHYLQQGHVGDTPHLASIGG